MQRERNITAYLGCADMDGRRVASLAWHSCSSYNTSKAIDTLENFHTGHVALVQFCLVP